MSDYIVVRGNKELEYSNSAEFLQVVESLLQLGIAFSVSIIKGATTVLQKLNELFESHDIEIVVDQDSDPELADYVLNTMVGAATGAAGGAAVSAGLWFLLKQGVKMAVPGVGIYLTVGSLAGAAIGALAGGASTKLGLRIQLSPKRPELIDMAFLPLPQDG